MTSPKLQREYDRLHPIGRRALTIAEQLGISDGLAPREQSLAMAERHWDHSSNLKWWLTAILAGLIIGIACVILFPL